jgi:3-phosphoshikimate 1-carboxyvinyltransferase
MRTLVIEPSNIKGSVHIPSSKSLGHREIICAALANGVSTVDNISMSEDIIATCETLSAFGVEFEPLFSKIEGRSALKIIGCGGKLKAVKDNVDCGESGSTLRFLLPFGAMLDEKIKFTGRGKLVKRPLEPFFDIFSKKGIKYKREEGLSLPLEIKGKLTAGDYELPGNVSSQFITGLLFVLPLLDGNSTITITTKLESRSYIDLTIDSLSKYGIKIKHDNYLYYEIEGNQEYKACDTMVEGDYSQIAYWLIAGVLSGPVSSQGVNFQSNQGDSAIIEIMQKMGVNFDFIEAKSENSINEVITSNTKTKGTIIDATDCPDIIPPLAVLAALSEGETKIINAKRLRIKECDRLLAINTELTKLGADIIELDDGLIIKGVNSFKGGVTINCWNDHRIAMSLAIAAIKCDQAITLEGAECVNKSYPDFWDDYKALGAKITEL